MGAQPLTPRDATASTAEAAKPPATKPNGANAAGQAEEIEKLRAELQAAKEALAAHATAQQQQPRAEGGGGAPSNQELHDMPRAVLQDVQLLKGSRMHREAPTLSNASAHVAPNRKSGFKPDPVRNVDGPPVAPNREGGFMLDPVRNANGPPVATYMQQAHSVERRDGLSLPPLAERRQELVNDGVPGCYIINPKSQVTLTRPYEDRVTSSPDPANVRVTSRRQGVRPPSP